MLHFFRSRETTARVILGGFLVLICAAMVITLIPGFGSGSGNEDQQVIASVNGHDIMTTDFSRQLSEIEQTRQLPPAYAAIMGRQLLGQMVLQRAVLDEADRMGLSVSDEELARGIRQQNPQLFKDGSVPSQEDYASYVENYHRASVPQYEERLREQLLEFKLYHLVTDGVRVSDSDIRKEFLRRNEKAKIDYVVVKPADLMQEVPVSDQDLRAYYQRNQARYLSAERRTVDVVMADTSKFAARANVSDDDIGRYYQQHRAQYSTPERVKAAHILLKTTGKSAAEVAQIRKTADDLLKQVRAGGDFAALAKQHSEDDATVDQGGELGWIQRGRTVKAFEDAAFSLQPGSISDLVQTEYGFHIIKVEAHEPAHTQMVVEAHDAIAQQLHHERGLNDAQNAVNQARNLAIHDTPLNQITQQLGLDLISPPPITRTDPISGIGVNQEFANAVFLSGVKAVTPVVKVGQGFAFARVTGVQPPAIQPFTDVRMQIEREYRQQKAEELARTRAQQLAENARKNGLRAAAAALHLQLKSSEPVGREGSLPDAGSISDFSSQLFALQPNQVGGPTASGTSQIVYSLLQRQQPPADQLAKDRETVANSLLNEKRQRAFQAFQDSLEARLRKSGKIKIHETVVRRMLGSGEQGS